MPVRLWRQRFRQRRTPAATTSGVVTWQLLRAPKVCIDANANAQCDSGEASTYTDAKGAFTLTGQGRWWPRSARMPSATTTRAP
jgi:hypothetical protein